MPSAAFQKWIDEINQGVKEKLIPVLKANGMALDDNAYVASGIELGDPILQMSDFNSLIALSQKHQAPIFALKDEQLEQTGIVLERTKKSMRHFRELFEKSADTILGLINYEGN